MAGWVGGPIDLDDDPLLVIDEVGHVGVPVEHDRRMEHRARQPASSQQRRERDLEQAVGRLVPQDPPIEHGT